MTDAQIEKAAAVLAKLLPNAISVSFDGEACTAEWPGSFGPHELAAFRLVTRAMFGAVSSPKHPETDNG